MSNLRALTAVVTVSLLAAALGGCGDEESGDTVGTRRAGSSDANAAQRAAAHRLYWVGRSFEGLPLTGVSRDPGLTTFMYGTCTPPPGYDAGGCSPPLQIQVASICDRNALVLDVRPRARFVVRGVSVLDYGEGRRELAIGESNVVVWANPARGRRAIGALRPVGRPARGSSLTAPRYPRYYVAQLRRVYDAYARTKSARAVRDELGISKSAVRFELALARELGAARLRRAGRAGRALKDIKRDRLTVMLEGSHLPANGSRMTPSELQKRAQRGRALRSGCTLEPA